MKLNGIEVTGITNDSRKVKPGFAFFAIKGVDMDATPFIPNALDAGASIIVTDEEYKGESFKVPDVRKFLTETAMRFYKPMPENIIAVTGTSGKTSVVHFCRHMLEKLAGSAASIGSLGLVYKGKTAPLGAAHNTSPDPVLLCETLNKLKSDGCDHVALEATSQGLAQDRIVRPIKVAAFTNFSREHISAREHKDMDDYFSAKKKLFAEFLADDGTVVLNADTEKFFELKELAGDKKVISYGRGGEQMRLLDLAVSEKGVHPTVAINGKVYDYEINSAGEFQAHNSMCAIGMIMGLGFDAADAVRAIEGADSPDGRLRYVGSPVAGGGVYVDFAHGPDQIINVLKAARGFCKGRLMVVVAACGKRDPGKRPVMGRAARDYADVVYVTDDCPRTEDPAAIREMVASGCPGAIVVPGRADAIRRAVSDMKENDVLVLVNKGHENFVEIGTEIFPWSDSEEVQKCLANMDKKMAGK
jgi:UDP-N-acetylmuramoyl-L-alanyl-D-glutamate--2,6-diaminopimelate ligase